MGQFSTGDWVKLIPALTGAIGLMFIRLAAMKGARIIATDIDQSRLVLAKKMGASQIINISLIGDVVSSVQALTDERRGADVVIEATGLPLVWNNSIKMARKGGFILLFGGTKQNSVLEIDTTLLHYAQLTIKGVFHTTPCHVAEAFELLKMNILATDDFIQNTYALQDLQKALEEHAMHRVVKNCIIYD